MQRLQSLAFVMAATGGFPVDGDDVVPTWPESPDPTLEARAEQKRIDPVDQGSQPAGARYAEMEWRDHTQKLEMIFSPGDYVVKIIAAR
jgi:hypothetical protein